ncbi:uncharacterized protein LOC131232341 [Magnolia sinica]|uniref:uncharacterized protein LOC131232341 n=1 Tax=Magnolia sinica TaxID=86752 RepID=UPI00265AB353|nr:uncharacterized protein LOC131232341 [Magnolia sinica]
MVIATDEVWDGYITSHLFAEKVRGKHIERFTDLAFMFGSDCAHGSFTSTAYLSPLSGRRRSRNEFNTDSESDDIGTETVRLSSDSGDDHDSGSAFRAIDGSQRVHSVRTVLVETSRGSKSTNSTATSYTRQKRSKASDVIGDRMGEVAEAVKSLTITMSQGKTMATLQRLLSILEKVDGLSPEDQIRAAQLMRGDLISAGYFLKIGHEKRKE